MSRAVGALVATLLLLVVVAGSRAVSGAEGKSIAWSGPITISSGGTYTGNWLSTDSTPAVQIATEEPVVIVNSTVSNVGGGVLVDSPYSVPSNVTLDHVTAQGGDGRFYEAENFKSVVIRNCTIDRTSGIKLVTPVASSSVLVTRNRHRNIQPGAGGYPGNFVQLVSVQ